MSYRSKPDSAIAIAIVALGLTLSGVVSTATAEAPTTTLARGQGSGVNHAGIKFTFNVTNRTYDDGEGGDFYEQAPVKGQIRHDNRVCAAFSKDLRSGVVVMRIQDDFHNRQTYEKYRFSAASGSYRGGIKRVGHNFYPDTRIPTCDDVAHQPLSKAYELQSGRITIEAMP